MLLKFFPPLIRGSDTSFNSRVLSCLCILALCPPRHPLLWSDVSSTPCLPSRSSSSCPAVAVVLRDSGCWHKKRPERNSVMDFNHSKKKERRKQGKGTTRGHREMKCQRRESEDRSPSERTLASQTTLAHTHINAILYLCDQKASGRKETEKETGVSDSASRDSSKKNRKTKYNNSCPAMSR